MQRKAIDLYTKRSNTSPKDEFVKWAKLDREYNSTRKQIATLSKYWSEMCEFDVVIHPPCQCRLINLLTELAQASEKSKTSFTRAVSTVLFLALGGLKIYVRVHYRKQPVAWLPKGIFPYPVLWLLSLFSSPLGSVSVTVWMFIVDSALATLSSAGLGVYNWIKQGPAATASKAGTKVQTQVG